MNPLEYATGEHTESVRNPKGIVTATVTNNRDPEGMGRVKVSFAWDQDEYESYWARVMSFMAGNGRGGYFLPEVGDEVVVGFLEGEVERPVVLGALWNGRDTVPEKNENGKNDIRKIRSRSGHEIVLDDTASAEKIEIRSHGGHRIVLDDTGGEEKMVMEDKSGNRVEMDPVSGKLTVAGVAQISMEAKMIEIKAESVLTLRGTLVKIN